MGEDTQFGGHINIGKFKIIRSYSGNSGKYWPLLTHIKQNKENVCFYRETARRLRKYHV